MLPVKEQADAPPSTLRCVHRCGWRHRRKGILHGSIPDPQKAPEGCVAWQSTNGLSTSFLAGTWLWGLGCCWSCRWPPTGSGMRGTRLETEASIAGPGGDVPLPASPWSQYFPRREVRRGSRACQVSCFHTQSVRRASRSASHGAARWLRRWRRPAPSSDLMRKCMIPFAAGGSRYSVRKEGDRCASIRRPAWMRRERRSSSGPKRCTLRSAPVSRGRSYLIDTDGVLRMSPLTWYPEHKAWDLSPGYEKNNQNFNRPGAGAVSVLPCQSSQRSGRRHEQEQRSRSSRARPSAASRLPRAGRAACGGVPGRDRLPAKGEIDETIVNPARLSPALRDAVCQQCHISGKARVLKRGRQQYDYRPGFPLDDFIATFVRSARRAGSSSFRGARGADARSAAASRPAQGGWAAARATIRTMPSPAPEKQAY